ncbi:MAG TPA: Xaa-Pro peptidase family protein, partial [Bacteroidota bacterium]|nr:Xaa-Pro peptidase family protein [Bacteroidota bacterium]
MVERRLQEVRRHLAVLELDAFFVSHTPHVRYLTGFSGSNGLCVITRQHQYFLTDPRYRSQSKAEVKGFAIHVTSTGLLEEVAKRRLVGRAKRIGIESAHLSVESLSNIRKLIGGVKVVPTRSIVERIAAVKDETEIGKIRRAVEVTERVFHKILHLLKPGVAEQEISAEIGYWHKRFGADGDAFEPIVVSGVRGALPHGRASSKKIKRGELVTLDLGCTLDGYSSDLTRTVAIGTPSARARTIYRVVLEAQAKAIEAARPGIKTAVLDQTARAVIAGKGFGKYFSHSLGHGLGIEIHEELRLSAQSKERLRQGNV